MGLFHGPVLSIRKEITKSPVHKLRPNKERQHYIIPQNGGREDRETTWSRRGSSACRRSRSSNEGRLVNSLGNSPFAEGDLGAARRQVDGKEWRPQEHSRSLLSLPESRVLCGAGGAPTGTPQEQVYPALGWALSRLFIGRELSR